MSAQSQANPAGPARQWVETSIAGNVAGGVVKNAHFKKYQMVFQKTTIKVPSKPAGASDSAQILYRCFVKLGRKQPELYLLLNKDKKPLYTSEDFSSLRFEIGWEGKVRILDRPGLEGRPGKATLFPHTLKDAQFKQIGEAMFALADRSDKTGDIGPFLPRAANPQ